MVRVKVRVKRRVSSRVRAMVTVRPRVPFRVRVSIRTISITFLNYNSLFLLPPLAAYCDGMKLTVADGKSRHPIALYNMRFFSLS